MIYLGPDPRTPLEVLDADPRVRICGSFLDAEAEGDGES